MTGVILIGIRCLCRLLYYAQPAEVLLLEYTFLMLGDFRFSFVILLDMLRVLFLITVSLITVAVLIFRLSYIGGDKYFTRFHLLLISFVLRMYFLVLSPNLVSLLLGWDGLGLTSYLLVIYYGNSKAYNSGIVTALTNRLGDALLLVGVGYLASYGSWNFIFYFNKTELLVAVLLILTATTKRAQIPFSAWLPAAMAAPTPVSSLVHSSTLVTAGVYLLVRHSEFLSTNHVAWYLIIMGALTITMASLRALFERDLKKIVALSTLSQLGVIILSLGLGAVFASFFHLLSHAFFKALLFLGTGSIIHNRKDYQDIRVIGRGLPGLPVTHARIFLARLRLMGIPFISAFFSKEIILETILIKNFNFLVYLIMLFGILLTALYRTRFIVLSFTRASNRGPLGFKLDEDTHITQGILILLIPATTGGFFLGRILFSRALVRTSRVENKVLVLRLLVLGVLTRLYLNLILWKLNWKKVLRRLSILWVLPDVRTRPWLVSYHRASNQVAKLLDRGLIFDLRTAYRKIIPVWTGVNTPILSILKILNLFFIWGLVIRLYYLCDITQTGRNSWIKVLT